ncbi:hypothetical protein LC605_20330 [Nostoc sp. CHAB 5836]|nr:hypothetical protein [Nostoc sp. CHAB 5836]MCC5617390.1 hypothetical protein [Nostoc sp. CHAB 5836]
MTPKDHGGGAIAKIPVEDLPLVQQLVGREYQWMLLAKVLQTHKQKCYN